MAVTWPLFGVSSPSWEGCRSGQQEAVEGDPQGHRCPSWPPSGGWSYWHGNAICRGGGFRGKRDWTRGTGHGRCTCASGTITPGTRVQMQRF